MKWNLFPVFCIAALLGCNQAPPPAVDNGAKRTDEGNAIASNRTNSNYNSAASQPIVPNSEPSGTQTLPPAVGGANSPASLTRSQPTSTRSNVPTSVRGSVRNGVEMARMMNPYGGPAAETVRERYAIEGGSVPEIVGVFKVTEEGITCWDLEGNPQPDLAKKVFEKYNRPEGYSQGFTIFPGKKSRSIIYSQSQGNSRTATQPGPRRSTQHMSVVSAGDPNLRNMVGGGSFNYFENESKVVGTQNISVNFQSRFVVEPSTAKETSVRIQVTESLLENNTMDLKAGSSVSANGITYTVENIFEGLPKGRHFGASGGVLTAKVWTIEIGTKGKAIDPKINCSIGINRDGGGPGMVDSNGEPVNDFMKLPAEQRMNIRPADSQTFAGSGKDLSMMLFINPKYVSKLRLHLSKSKFVDIVGIPLDPR